jgi:hypothetical protein
LRYDREIRFHQEDRAWILGGQGLDRQRVVLHGRETLGQEGRVVGIGGRIGVGWAGRWSSEASQAVIAILIEGELRVPPAGPKGDCAQQK